MKYILFLLTIFLCASPVDALTVKVKHTVTVRKVEAKSFVQKRSIKQTVTTTPARSDSDRPAMAVNELSWEEMKLIAVKVARKHDIHPAVLVGMTTLESGRGTSYYCVARNNCGGIGAYDSNPDSAFHFESYYEYVDYLAKMLSGGRYAKAYEARHDPYAMVREIKAAGYATSPTYVEKVTSLPEFKDYIY